MHECKKSIKACLKILKSFTFPENTHPQKSIANKEWQHTYQRSQNKGCRFSKTGNHSFIILGFEQIPYHIETSEHATNPLQLIRRSHR